MSSKIYDELKKIAILWLPALGTLYFTLSTIWGAQYFPCAEQVVGSITAIDTFLGAILEVSRTTYNNKIEAENEDS